MAERCAICKKKHVATIIIKPARTQHLGSTPVLRPGQSMELCFVDVRRVHAVFMPEELKKPAHKHRKGKGHARSRAVRA